MFEKLIICITNQKLTAGLWRRGLLHSYQTYPNNEEGYEAFAAFLLVHANTSLYVIADAVEEDYRLDNLPHTTGNARHELLNRKLSQLYRNSAYRAALFVGRDQEKRRDDRFLMVSLNNAEFIQPWIAIIDKLRAPLVGIYLFSSMSVLLAKRLRIKAPNLLFSERLSSGLRQTYIQNGQLRISRLAPIPPEMMSRLGAFYLAETEKTRLYLISQRFIGRESEINMVIPALNESARDICRAIEQEHAITCESVDLKALAAEFKLGLEHVEQHPELVHMHVLAIETPPDSLAPHQLTKHHKLNALRRLINAVSVSIVLVGTIISTTYLWDTIQSDSDYKDAAIQTKIEEHKYNEVAKDFPKTPISSTDLESVAGVKTTIVSYEKQPKRMMTALSKVLNEFLEVQINRLYWVQTDNINFPDKETTLQNNTSTSNSAAASAFQPQSGIMYEIGFINGEIRHFNGDYRSALNRVNQLADQIRKETDVAQVEILQAPVNVSSYTDLKGSTTDEKTAMTSSAFFKLKIVLKPVSSQP